ncbi:tautomerase family protein [Devosia lacusdianchii]|uniref:tautomerase family protein n=1 Tax=Devosia lacusdianchii TaxID=2917991 RepID=UPI001F06EDF3|nr:tautomerase family protein [Devosia sp. JXJ CY 41]
MPLTRISLRKGKSPEYCQTLMEQIYLALRETFDVPDEDRFVTISEHGSEHFDFSANYLGIQRTDDLVIIQITANNTRTVEKKRALYAKIVERLVASLGMRPQDVLISIVEVAKENWSFGNGEAQYAPAV